MTSTNATPIAVPAAQPTLPGVLVELLGWEVTYTDPARPGLTCVEPVREAVTRAEAIVRTARSAAGRSILACQPIVKDHRHE